MSVERDANGPGAPGGADDYLWDGSGVPDPTVERLEWALEPARWTGGARAPRTAGTGLRAGRVMAAAAVVALAALGTWRVMVARTPGPSPAVEAGPGWQVTALQGSPRVGSVAVSGMGAVRTGEWLTTDGASRASLAVGAVGHVTVEASSRVRLVNTGEHEHRMELAEGKISAFIAAPPRLFLVETPAALAVDMGCIYTLEVGADGSGELAVRTGLVELERAGRTGSARVSRVPAGAVCRIDGKRGPGTPRAADAPPALVRALDAFDGAGGGAGDVESIVREARGRDAVTLWHLLARVEPAARAAVAGALERVAPAGDARVREGAERLEEEALEAWWKRVLATM